MIGSSSSTTENAVLRGRGMNAPGYLLRAVEKPALLLRLATYQLAHHSEYWSRLLGHAGSNGHSRLARLNPIRDVPGKRQSDQFRFYKKLARIGVPLVDDPLFRCDVEPATSNGFVGAQVVYRGLRIKGFGNRTQIVDLLLDGHLIRRDRVRADRKGSPFWLYVNRPALERFPPRCDLTVQARDPKTGRLFHEASFRVHTPHGTGGIFQTIERIGLIDKKGNLPISTDELARRQEALLNLYEELSPVFHRVAGRPLFLLYGTLLGLHRDGGFIPGDDDFDVGYVSEHEDPILVKREAKEIIVLLAREGFTLTLNRKGKPFRIHDEACLPDLHLDACPVWRQDGKIWTNPYGCLSMSLDAFRRTEHRSFRGRTVIVPEGTEEFLEAYYGAHWRVPDPDYPLSRPLPEETRRNLLEVCLRPPEVARLSRMIERAAERNGSPGRLQSKALCPLYPLARYQAVCGWD